ncbi:MAG: hypothetical protein ABI702_20465 [Burkholderiales bacterium]
MPVVGVGGLLATRLVDAIVQQIDQGDPMAWPTLKLLDGKALTADAWNVVSLAPYIALCE